MDAEAHPLDPLLRQWRDLPVGDRKNILQRLPVEQRFAFQRILAASERQSAETTVRAHRFRACSPWLGELLDACEKDAPAAGMLKPHVRAALLEGHSRAAEGGSETDMPPALVTLAQSLIKSVRDWL